MIVCFSLNSGMWYFSAMWSVRMRASKTVDSCQSSVVSRKGSEQAIHISGAEGLYKTSEINKIIKEYALRAMGHPRGRPDKVVITVEEIREIPVVVPPLPFSTVRCVSPDDARQIIAHLLLDAGVSGRAIRNGMRVVFAKAAMPGASIVTVNSGIRVEPDRKRGVRVSRLGIKKSAERDLSGKLSKDGINTPTVREAIMLASKVTSCEDVMAELCVSDDPGYTTGYVASRKAGYIRVPHIKKKGSSCGGRVFFVGENADVRRIIEYLEKVPVILGL